jgi:hypothetical protein
MNRPQEGNRLVISTRLPSPHPIDWIPWPLGTEEDLQSMMENPEFLRNLEAAGWPSEPIEQIYQVHATIP